MHSRKSIPIEVVTLMIRDNVASELTISKVFYSGSSWARKIFESDGISDLDTCHWSFN